MKRAVAWLRGEPVLAAALVAELTDLGDLLQSGSLTAHAVLAAVIAVGGAALRCFVSPADRIGVK